MTPVLYLYEIHCELNKHKLDCSAINDTSDFLEIHVS